MTLRIFAHCVRMFDHRKGGQIVLSLELILLRLEIEVW